MPDCCVAHPSQTLAYQQYASALSCLRAWHSNMWNNLWMSTKKVCI